MKAHSIKLSKVTAPSAMMYDNVLRINIKPLSVNEAWRGQRFKTAKYGVYERTLMVILPKKYTVPAGPIKIFFLFGFSSMQSDWDNGIKQIQDILSKKYKFRDVDIFFGGAMKTKVAKGEEFIKVSILPFVEKDKEDFLKNFLPL